MTSPAPMLACDGHVPIGEIRDVGAGKIFAVRIGPTGERVSLGYHPTRRAAMAAISARHDSAEPPPRAA